MTTAVPSGRGTGPGRLDPTVRGLLRAFLSPAVADRYASALQPVATADRDAALAGAVTTLRARFYVPAEELAVALVEDAGWSVADVATMLGIPTLEVRGALRAAAGDAEPRISAARPDDLDEDEVAMVDAMLAELPRTRRDAATVAEEDDDEEQVDVEISSTLPAHVGLPSLEARIRRADRLQSLVVNLTVVGVVALVGLTMLATADPDGVATDPDTVTADPDTVPARPGQRPTPGASPAPGGAVPPSPPPPTEEPTEDGAVTTGPVEVTGTRFVATVDPTTGAPGDTITSAPPASNPRLWFRLVQLPQPEFVLEVVFTAPSGRTTLRPVLVTTATPQVSLRLPDEFGRDPGRYAARVEADGELVGAAEIELVAPAEG